MSRITRRDSAPRNVDVEQQLARLLDSPLLAQVVPRLPPETLHRLVRHCGLDACVELLAAATPAQLNALADADLWRRTGSQGRETFDVERFGEWLEALASAGGSITARTVAALDKDVLVAGLSRYIRVFDPGIFEPTAQSDDERMDRGESMHEGDSLDIVDATASDRSHAADGHEAEGEDAIECEIGGYIVRARTGEAWDAVVALLLALDAEDPRSFHALMQGCRRLSNCRPEVDGLDDLLPEPEQHLHDVAIARDERRSRGGYATAADARAFLRMARAPRSGAAAAPMPNPIASAYFRAADEGLGSPDEAVRAPDVVRPSLTSLPAAASDPGGNDDAPGAAEAVVALLTEAVVLADRRPAPEAAVGDAKAGGRTHVERLMAYVREEDETASYARTRELAFLANILLAGCTVQARPFTTAEASAAAAAVCNLGLDGGPARWPGTTSARVSARRDGRSPGIEPITSPPDAFLVDHDLVTAFELGWSILYNDVCLFTVERLIAMLDDLRSADRDVRHGLSALRRALVQARDAGTPWRARDAAEVLVMLDTTAWAGVIGLLDECPVLPAALAASLEGRTTRVSATDFSFISTAAQVADIQRFVRRLPDVLSR
jgi:hypothetical protein